MSQVNLQQTAKKDLKAEGRSIGLILLEVFTVILFLLFMLPFLLVILNSAKTSKR